MDATTSASSTNQSNILTGVEFKDNKGKIFHWTITFTKNLDRCPYCLAMPGTKITCGKFSDALCDTCDKEIKDRCTRAIPPQSLLCIKCKQPYKDNSETIQDLNENLKSMVNNLDAECEACHYKTDYAGISVHIKHCQEEKILNCPYLKNGCSFTTDDGAGINHHATLCNYRPASEGAVTTTWKNMERIKACKHWCESTSDIDKLNNEQLKHYLKETMHATSIFGKTALSAPTHFSSEFHGFSQKIFLCKWGCNAQFNTYIDKTNHENYCDFKIIKCLNIHKPNQNAGLIC